MSTFVAKKTKKGFRVLEEKWVNGKRTSPTVPKLSYNKLGFNPEWTIEQARERVTAINALNSEARKVTGAARRVVKGARFKSILLPNNLVDDFLLRLQDNSFGSETHKKRLMSHWSFVAKMVIELKLDPPSYSDHKEQIYKYLISKRVSPDYSNKLLRVLNEWGFFMCKHLSKPFERVPPPKGSMKSAIEEAYLDGDNFQGESDPITPEMLKLFPESTWLAISVWFGLRPKEIDGLKQAKNWKLIKEDEINILGVYQSKLTGLEREKRWKYIPILFKEQKDLLEAIKTGNFKRPLTKTVQNRLKTDQVTLYGGRKGFLDLMLNNQQKLEDISMWLGHQSIEMTWKRYRNKRRISYTKIS